MFTLTERANHLESSSIMEITARAQFLKSQGKPILSLAAGEPDFATPEPIVHAVSNALAQGHTKYVQASGVPAFREAIAQWVTKHNGYTVTPDEVLPTMGAKHAIFMTLQCLVEQGIEVAVPTPAWVSYKPMIEFMGGTYRPIETALNSGFQPHVELLEQEFQRKKFHGIIVNSPNNPTGVVYSPQLIRKISKWAYEKKVWVLSDEIYEKVLFDGNEHYSFAKESLAAQANTITVSGFSKSHCMTGWRVGWIVAHSAFIKKLAALQSQMNSHVTSFIQIAGIEATQVSDANLNEMVGAFDERRKFLMKYFESLEGTRYVRPGGAFYLFVDMNKILTRMKMTDIEFCKLFLEEQFVAAVPASQFGYTPGGLRISFATSLENLKEATERLSRFLR